MSEMAELADHRRTLTVMAEVRAIEENHHAFLTADPRVIEVRSDTYVDGQYKPLVYMVTLATSWPRLAFYCNHPQVMGVAECPAVAAPGFLPCKHAALAARRWMREGKAEIRWDDSTGALWFTTEPGPEPVSQERLDDLFARLERSQGAC